MDESLKRLLDVIESQENRIMNYWKFYILIVVATIGWLMSSKTPFTVYQSTILAISIALILASNFYSIRTATKRMIALETELFHMASNIEFQSPELAIELSRPVIKYRLKMNSLIHLFIDFAVIYAIWSKFF